MGVTPHYFNASYLRTFPGNNDIFNTGLVVKACALCSIYPLFRLWSKDWTVPPPIYNIDYIQWITPNFRRKLVTILVGSHVGTFTKNSMNRRPKMQIGLSFYIYLYSSSRLKLTPHVIWDIFVNILYWHLQLSFLFSCLKGPHEVISSLNVCGSLFIQSINFAVSSSPATHTRRRWVMSESLDRTDCCLFLLCI